MNGIAFSLHQFPKSIVLLFDFILRVVTSCCVSWMVLSKQDYLYSAWLSKPYIMEWVSRVAKRNLQNPDYACTTFDGRVDAFQMMKNAIHHSPNDIPELYFESPCNIGQVIYLTPPEIHHLKEVSRLVDIMQVLSPVLILLWLALIVVKIFARTAITKLSHDFLSVIFLVFLCFLVTKIIGTDRLYTYAHVIMFSADDQWIYSFNESIMITMFAGSNFFLFLSAYWFGLSLILLCLLTFFQRACMKWILKE